MDQFLHQKLLDLGFNGVALVVVKGMTILEAGYGYANYEHEVKNTRDTVFRVASISKEFMAAAILKLIESGKLELNQSVEEFFPEFKYAKDIKIHHLLSNSSGVPDFTLQMDFYDILHSDDILQGLIDLAKDKDLLFEPGSEFYYSIPGYLMLHKILEIVSGMDLESYLKQTIFNEVGMLHTGLDLPNRLVKNKAGAYALANDGSIQLSKFIDMRIAGGAGGFYSTLGDLHKWNLYLREQTGLLKEMFGRHIKADDHNFYGYGIITGIDDEHGENRIYHYHTGGGPGVRSINLHYPKEDIEVVLISNLEDRVTFQKAQNTILEHLLNL
ncbi:MAG: serine hydrolase [Bacilli bacterium]|nr:serine hydrolase [Bacilli bacterium]MBN2876885.1 serine hydrolase [Bacilli bacterium]